MKYSFDSRPGLHSWEVQKIAKNLVCNGAHFISHFACKTPINHFRGLRRRRLATLRNCFDFHEFFICHKFHFLIKWIEIAIYIIFSLNMILSNRFKSSPSSLHTKSTWHRNWAADNSCQLFTISVATAWKLLSIWQCKRFAKCSLYRDGCCSTRWRNVIRRRAQVLHKERLNLAARKRDLWENWASEFEMP